MPLETVLQINIIKQCYALLDPAMEDALSKIESMHRFAWLVLASDALPDKTMILKFRQLLERHGQTTEMMIVINDTLEERGLLLEGGMKVDATIVHAQPSTTRTGKISWTRRFTRPKKTVVLRYEESCE